MRLGEEDSTDVGVAFQMHHWANSELPTLSCSRRDSHNVDSFSSHDGGRMLREANSIAQGTTQTVAFRQLIADDESRAP
jgi:hypothetical protein